MQGPAPEPVPVPAATEPAPAFTAADFPNGADVRMLAMLALAIDGAANPPLDAESNQPEPFWPQALAKKPWPYALAWAVTLTELIGGVLLLVGLFTRLSALAISGVMLGAMWLTQIGPAIQSGHTILGFLPDYPRFDPGWMTLMWQFSLFAASFAVFLLGSGVIGIDRALFRGSRYHAYDTGPTYTPAGEFDRAPREPKP
ncbi:MAG: DoxX family protein [Phycisphaerales bacterium]